MSFTKKHDDQNKVSSGKTNAPVEIHEALRIKQYLNVLKSKKPVRELQESVKSNEEAFKKFEELIKTAKYRKHQK